MTAHSLATHHVLKPSPLLTPHLHQLPHKLLVTLSLSNHLFAQNNRSILVPEHAVHCLVSHHQRARLDPNAAARAQAEEGHVLAVGVVAQLD